MATYRTPGIYIEERSAFLPSVAEVQTAIPVFIGYTQKAMRSTANDLVLKPTKIHSMREYELLFGACDYDTIDITVTDSDSDSGDLTTAAFSPPTPKYILWYCMKMFYDNGGGQCHIVSTGTYQTPAVIDLRGDAGTDLPTMYGLQDGLTAVQTEDEPSLIVIPEAIHLQDMKYQKLVRAVLEQCNTLRDRFAVFDVLAGADALDPTALSINRGYFGNNHLKYGAAYYPFLRTTLNHQIDTEEANVNVTYNDDSALALGTLKTSNTTLYNYVHLKLKEAYMVLPPSSAVAGVYAATDRNRGVWKAPANVSLASVIEPVVMIDNATQNALKVDVATGKSINAVRAFKERGTLVWGARTLAGNDNQWRYISVRRFFNMVEESVRKSTCWAVFKPNDANTWGKVRGMIENYLIQKWRQGALAGAKAEEAFYVNCGLGITMSSADILEGRIIVEIGMAAVRPAEFVIFTFSHKVQPA